MDSIAQQIPAERISFDIAEAALISGFSRSYLYERLQEGTGPRAKKLGRRIIVMRDDLIAWLNAQQDYRAAA